MGMMSNIFGSQRKKRVASILANGGIIIDVRFESEFKNGHAPGSKNFPLKQLATQIDTIKALNKPIVVVCMSGIRSGQAKTILEKEGIEVENGGSWYAFK
jgi:rhodanese-related sulfurtransferase